MPRILDNEVGLYLEAFGAVLIVGLKWCGKTTTGRKYSNSAIELQNPGVNHDLMKLADIDIGKLLEGAMAYVRSDGVLVVPIGCLKN